MAFESVDSAPDVVWRPLDLRGIRERDQDSNASPEPSGGNASSCVGGADDDTAHSSDSALFVEIT
jgi:hypothetical protein